MDFAALGEAQAAAEKEKNRQKKEMESLQQVRDHARKIRQSRVHTEKSQDKNNTKTKNEADGTTNNKNHVDMMHGADWTTTYRHFDDWEDPEELAAEAEVSYREENVFFFLLNNNDNNNNNKNSTFINCMFLFFQFQLFSLCLTYFCCVISNLFLYQYAGIGKETQV